jgi:hypothetical protein
VAVLTIKSNNGIFCIVGQGFQHQTNGMPVILYKYQNNNFTKVFEEHTTRFRFGNGSIFFPTATGQRKALTNGHSELWVLGAALRWSTTRPELAGAEMLRLYTYRSPCPTCEKRLLTFFDSSQGWITRSGRMVAHSLTINRNTVNVFYDERHSSSTNRNERTWIDDRVQMRNGSYTGSYAVSLYRTADWTDLVYDEYNNSPINNAAEVHNRWRWRYHATRRIIDDNS